MLIGSFAGAAAALALALVFVIRPRLAFRAAHLLEHVGQGRGDAAVRLFVVVAILGAVVGALTRL